MVRLEIGHGLRAGAPTMALRFRMAVRAYPIIRLHEVRWFIVLDVAVRTPLGHELHGRRMIGGQMPA